MRSPIALKFNKMEKRIILVMNINQKTGFVENG